MTIDERLEHLRETVAGLAQVALTHDYAIKAHDRQIGVLIAKADKSWTEFEELRREMAETRREMAETRRQWQAYLNTLPKQ